MKFAFLVLFCATYSYTHAQNSKKGNGINFNAGVSIEEIISMAIQENKVIFIDCYATWCGPCKKMETEVFANDTVGQVMAKNFVAYKLQMDTTGKDNIHTIKNYKTADSIRRIYNISSFPSFLFLSSTGELLHKEIGARNMKNFLSLLNSVLNPNEQFYSLLKKYFNGVLEDSLLLPLAQLTNKVWNKDIAKQIALAHIKYVEQQPDSIYFKKENIMFIAMQTEFITSKSKLFTASLNTPAKVDSAIDHLGYAKKLVDYVVISEEISSEVKKTSMNTGSPNWTKLKKIISLKYNQDIAIRTILTAKTKYYKSIKNWKRYVENIVRKVEYDRPSLPNNTFGAFYLNSNAWEVFLYSSNRRELRKALIWSETAIRIDTGTLVAADIDTKANILYKLRKKTRALELEEQAYSISPTNPDILENLERMKKDIPTWLHPTSTIVKTNL